MPLARIKGRTRGRAIDWGWLKRWWDDMVPKIAPVTSKLVGPIATALTGVPIPNIGDLIDKNPEAVNKALALADKAQTSLKASFIKGKGAPKAIDIKRVLDAGLRPRQSGKGFEKYS